MDRITRLAVEARDGDRLALADLVRSTQAEVWRFCAHQVSYEEADDLTQEVFLRAWRCLGGFRADASVKTWLIAIAWRVCSEARRTRRRRGAAVTRYTAGQQVAPEAEELGSSLGLLELLGSLCYERRAALVLTQLLGFSYAEAAEALSCPVGTVRSRVARAREDLLERLCEAERAGTSDWGSLRGLGKAEGSVST